MTKLMVDLFCGTKSMSHAFAANGYETLTIDNDSQHNPDICIDIFDLTIDMLPNKIDVLHMSPPCTCFSVAAMGHHWTGGKCAYVPKTEEAQISINLIEFSIELMRELATRNPDMLWYVENPRGVLRKMPIMIQLADEFTRHTLTYCQYGDTRMKPTDWWTNSQDWIPRPMCKNGAPCHERAPRGSKTGTQGLKNAIERGRIPADLCIEIAGVTH